MRFSRVLFGLLAVAILGGLTFKYLPNLSTSAGYVNKRKADAIEASFEIAGDQIVNVKANKTIYDSNRKEFGFTSIEPTNVKATIVDFEGVVIESVFVVFKEYSTLVGEHETKPAPNKISVVHFKLDPRAYKFQIFLNEGLQKEILVSSMEEYLY